MSGRVYLVGTPIGNLGDITLRAIETLKGVERVYAEDTRRTQVLLRHLGIEGKKLLSLNAHASERAIQTALAILAEGNDIALLTDAGMPGVSDPGAVLVRAARKAGHVCTVIPGPSAVTSAVALSGLVDSGFVFLGFLPRKGKKRTQALDYIKMSPLPVVLFESPHRVQETFVDLYAHLGEREIAVCRELTKKFEEVIAVPLSTLGTGEFRDEWLGEFTLVIEATSDADREATIEAEWDLETRARTLLLRESSVREVVLELTREAEALGLKLRRKDIYGQVQLLADQGENPEEGPEEDDADEESPLC